MEVRAFGRRSRGHHPRLYVIKERLESEKERQGGEEKTLSRLFLNRPYLLTRGMNLCGLFMDEGFECSPSCPRYYECENSDEV